MDEQAIYDPRDYNDKLLLGLKGTMSEAEQYWMRLRLQGGKLQQGASWRTFPCSPHRVSVGREHPPTSSGIPDEHIEHACDGCLSASRLMAVHMPSCGTSFGMISRSRCAMLARVKFTRFPRGTLWILGMLHNPIYTGAYVFGRREERQALVGGELCRRRVCLLSQDQWKTCLKDFHLPYIRWEEFMSNQQSFCGKPYVALLFGSPIRVAREGRALLQGLVLCGQCGHRIHRTVSRNISAHELRVSFSFEEWNGDSLLDRSGAGAGRRCRRVFL